MKDIKGLKAVTVEYEKSTTEGIDKKRLDKYGFMPMKALPKSEHEEQAAVIEWAAWNKSKYPELELLFAIPNGGHRHKGVAIKLKKEGAKAGVPDLCLPISRANYHSLWLEMKTLKGKTTLPQQRFLKLLNRYGHLAVVCFSAEEAIGFIKQYLELKS